MLRLINETLVPAIVGFAIVGFTIVGLIIWGAVELSFAYSGAAVLWGFMIFLLIGGLIAEDEGIRRAEERSNKEFEQRHKERGII
jgi:hypothetical protein